MSDDNVDGGNNAPPTILYTKNRTRTAASSARRRANKGLIQAAAGGGGGNCEDGGKDQHSWFARKSAGWTDKEIKQHITSGGTSKGGKSFSMIGDVILGDGGGSNNNGKKHKSNKKKKTKQRRGPTFAWEEEEEDDDDVGDGYNVHMQSRMTAAPTLKDIMDEQDEVDFMSPLKVGKSYQMNDYTSDNVTNSKTNDDKSSNSKTTKSRQNAALAELAQVSGLDHGGSTGSSSRRIPTSGNESIGYRLLRVLGYRSRLGMAFVPLSGYSGGKDGIDNEVVNQLEHKHGEELTHERKWLASKRLRAIRLPSILPKKGKDGIKHNVLTIPPPKNNRHGMGFDPFKNAPEFREFHERRRALAQKRGRATDDDNNKQAEGSKRGDRYFTDNLRKDDRQALWDKDHDDGRNDDDDDDMSAGHGDKSQHHHSHYAADCDYTDFIGTKASDGFALHDEDDANVYGEEDVGDNDRGGDYTTEIQSPVTSDEEDNSGLFGSKSVMATSKRKVSENRPSGSEDKVKVADAWSAWGMGEGNHNDRSLKRTTMDGKPPLGGFILSQSKFNIVNAQTEADAPKRWQGPMAPSGYVLKRHVFEPENYNDVAASSTNAMDAGLGLDLQHRQQHHQSSRSIAQKVLPPTTSGKLKQPPASEKMLAKDGSELNFHAVKESMKSRFVSSSAGGTDNTPGSTSAANDDKKQNMDKEEWVNVSVSSWMPTRLLCKRWGINVPAATGLMPSTTSELGGKVHKEESYFRQTIMADHPNVGNTTTTSASSADRGVGMQLDNYFLEDGENSAPPPSRPSAEVFQSIFNAESDMSISSEEHLSDGERSTTPAEKEMEKRDNFLLLNNETNTNQVDKGGVLAGDEGHSDSSSNVSSKQKRKRRKKSDRRKDNRRRDESNNTSDEESKRYYSDDDRRKRKKKKHKHRYRHKKSRH